MLTRARIRSWSIVIVAIIPHVLAFNCSCWSLNCIVILHFCYLVNIITECVGCVGTCLGFTPNSDYTWILDKKDQVVFAAKIACLQCRWIEVILNIAIDVCMKPANCLAGHRLCCKKYTANEVAQAGTLHLPHFMGPQTFLYCLEPD